MALFPSSFTPPFSTIAGSTLDRDTNPYEQIAYAHAFHSLDGASFRAQWSASPSERPSDLSHYVAIHVQNPSGAETGRAAHWTE